MTKWELIDLILTDDEKRNIDIALPRSFVDGMITEYGYDVRQYCVWVYNNMKGHPLNLAELYIERFLTKDAVTKNIIDINEHQ
jgi:hypothetical protein